MQDDFEPSTLMEDNIINDNKQDNQEKMSSIEDKTSKYQAQDTFQKTNLTEDYAIEDKAQQKNHIQSESQLQSQSRPHSRSYSQLHDRDFNYQNNQSNPSSSSSSKEAEIKSSSSTAHFEPPKETPRSQQNFSNTKKYNSSKTALVLSIIAILCGITSLSLTRQAINQGINLSRQTTGRDSNSANFTEGSIANVADSLSKSVVSISVNTTQRSLFGNDTTGQTGAGSGFILSSDGYIATNKHVVANATKISVILDDGTTYEDVEVIGTDPLNDFAIIKIKDVKGLTPVKLGDSKTTTKGQQVVAIGNAFGMYQNSITSGIISGKGRSLTATDSSRTQYETLSDMLQTDAAINGGNSGGPLVNAAGEVIGINTAYASQGNDIGFAIPISSVKGIIKNVLAGKSFERAVIGVRYTSITPTIAKEKNLPVKQGAYIGGSKDDQAIVPGSAGEKAGLKEGDIITNVNGTEIGLAGSLSSLIGDYAVGETINIAVLRNNKPLNLQLTLTAYKK